MPFRLRSSKTLALAVSATVVVGVSAACSSPAAPAVKAPATTAPAAAATQAPAATKAPQVDSAGRALVKTALVFDARSILSWVSIGMPGSGLPNEGFGFPDDALGLGKTATVDYTTSTTAVAITFTTAGCAVVVTYPAVSSALSRNHTLISLSGPGVAGEPTCTSEDPATAAAAQALTKTVLIAGGKGVQDALTGAAWSRAQPPAVGDFAAVLALATTDATKGRASWPRAGSTSSGSTR